MALALHGRIVVRALLFAILQVANADRSNDLRDIGVNSNGRFKDRHAPHHSNHHHHHGRHHGHHAAAGGQHHEDENIQIPPAENDVDNEASMDDIANGNIKSAAGDLTVLKDDKSQTPKSGEWQDPSSSGTNNDAKSGEFQEPSPIGTNNDAKSGEFQEPSPTGTVTERKPDFTNISPELKDALDNSSPPKGFGEGKNVTANGSSDLGNTSQDATGSPQDQQSSTSSSPQDNTSWLGELQNDVDADLNILGGSANASAQNGSTSANNSKDDSYLGAFEKNVEDGADDIVGEAEASSSTTSLLGVEGEVDASSTWQSPEPWQTGDLGYNIQNLSTEKTKLHEELVMLMAKINATRLERNQLRDELGVVTQQLLNMIDTKTKVDIKITTGEEALGKCKKMYPPLVPRAETTSEKFKTNQLEPSAIFDVDQAPQKLFLEPIDYSSYMNVVHRVKVVTDLGDVLKPKPTPAPSTSSPPKDAKPSEAKQNHDLEAVRDEFNKNVSAGTNFNASETSKVVKDGIEYQVYEKCVNGKCVRTFCHGKGNCISENFIKTSDTSDGQERVKLQAPQIMMRQADDDAEDTTTGSTYPCCRVTCRYEAQGLLHYIPILNFFASTYETECDFGNDGVAFFQSTAGRCEAVDESTQQHAVAKLCPPQVHKPTCTQEPAAAEDVSKCTAQ